MRIRSSFVTGGSLVAVALLSGCTAAGSIAAAPSDLAAGTKNSPSIPAATATPTPAPSGCVNINMNKDYGDHVIAGMHVHGTLSGLQFASEVDVAAGATTVVADG